ncbi:sugar ABC transporter substrate-binding protein [Tabrizicola sp. J26]|uniref:sugar ABC transporter substrate-binding protein n=1 Tax=Alitabrizicola rongguiensis TaxID=2909234 RepID=UPI001F46865F|nr:sugar ABC transporter substrate-binding protein [Tabrizicola rongguiensis]MCF1707943.1 sugar ABC transporter substrate-binding protein [Tabrizicola rongguiensis]
MRTAFRALALSTAAACLVAGAAQAQEPYKIFLSMSYIGNDWQAEAANMLKALASSSDYADKVDLKVQVAGPNAQKQIQQINAMVQAGADAIIVYPISPTALNGAVKNACEKGVKVIAYDGVIEEPCAWNVHVDQAEWGRQTAEWLAKEIGGKGNIVMITGVSGTSVDTLRNDAAREVFSKYPDIKVVAEANGMWSQAVARTEMSKIIATHPWESLSGLWMQVGCYTASSMQSEAGITDDKILPCAGEGSNGHRIQMLPAGTEVPGANGTYRPMGMRSISASSQAYPGAMALKMIVDVLDGKDVPKTVLLSPGAVTNDTVKVCTEGTWEEMKGGCNVFEPAIIPNPGWFASIYSEELPQVGLNAALTGTPEN